VPSFKPAAAASPAAAATADTAVIIHRVALGAVIAAGTAAFAWSVAELIEHPVVGSTWFVLLALTVVTGWSTLRMRYVPISFSISDTFTIAAALLFGPAAGTVVVVIDALVMSLRIARAGASGMALRVVFNAASTALAMWLAATAFFAMSGTGPLATHPGSIGELIGPLALFAALYFFLNTGMVAIAVAYERHAPVGSVWKSYLSALWLTYFGGAAIAAVLVLLTVSRVVNLTTLALVWPLLFILHVTYKAALDRAHEQVAHYAEIALYAAALRSTADAVMVTDHDGTVSFLNAAAEQLLGVGEHEAVGRPASEVYHAIDTATGEPRHGIGRPDGDVRDHVLVRADGTETPIEEMESDIRDAQGQFAGTIKTFRDISRRKAADEERDALLHREREARQTADAASRLKDEFLATLSHELRTPATGVLGWARLLKTGRMDEAQTRHALDALERSARAQATLLDDLLDMSRIVRGTLRIELEPTDVAAVLNGAIETVMPAINAKRIQFTLKRPAQLPAVRADADRLRQVFWNLLSNAVKFTGPGGTISVVADYDGDRVRIEVVDSGSGIDAEALPFIFDRFRQADGSSTRPHSGLGLGLAIVRHLVELHGGTVFAESEGRGRGARFVILLPAASAHPGSGN
jgi:PAS domain S-box-containing protein